MKKTISALIILLMSAVFLFCTACRSSIEDSIDKVVLDQVFALSNSGDEPPRKLTLLETDSFGRKLVSAEKNGSKFLNKHFYAYIVIQAADEEAGYCIPDISYVISYSPIELSDERIGELKTRNGWDTEPDRSKWRKVSVWYKGGMDDEPVKAAFASITGLNAGGFMSQKMLYEDLNGLKLAVVMYNGGENGAGRELYLLIVDKDMHAVAFEKVDDFLDIGRIISQVKNSAGWVEKQ